MSSIIGKGGPSVNELLERNRQYSATTHSAIPHMRQLMKGDFKANGPHILIVSCLDSRANPYEVLGVKPYEAMVLRNVSGRFSVAAPNIAALDTLFHVSQIILLHHSNCGATHLTEDEVVENVRMKRPEINEEELQKLRTLLPMRDDDETALIEDLQAARNCSFLRKDLTQNVVGFYLNVDSGLITQVEADSL